MSFLLLLFFFNPTTLFSQATIPDTSARALLSVHSMEEGASVFINGIALGKTPLRKLALLAGKYEVTVSSAHNMSWLDEDWREVVTLRASDSLALVARMRRGYRINSVPYGAQVWRAGRLLGTTPHVLRLWENQTASLEVKLQGYRSMLVEVGRGENGVGQRRNYEIVLQRDFDYAALQQQESAKRRAHAAKYRKLAYVSAALSVASGLGSILLKREADDAYEQYLVTGDPILRENYFSRAEKYDRYYSATFAVFEVSFGVSFYGVLKSLHNR